jgi:hydrogenase expression/formation protein HypC
MCLAIPGKVLSIASETPEMTTAKVSFGGIVKEVNLAFAPAARIGDYVIVHAGFAISILDEAEARKTLDTFEELGGAAEAVGG